MALPNKTFVFNYNAANFIADRHAFPKTPGQLYDYDMVLLTEMPQTAISEDHVYFPGNISDAYTPVNFGDESRNPFNRDSNNTTFTFIYKTGRFNSEDNLFANRADDYNYMVRGNKFHTSDSDYLYLDPPELNLQYCVIRVWNDGHAERKFVDANGNTISATTASTISWGGHSQGIAFFAGQLGGGEEFHGDFYWMYCSLETLSDAEVNQVISYNDNPGSISVNPSSLNVDYTGLTTAVTLDMESGTSWSATSVPSWINLSATAGTDAASITVVVSRNNNAQPRTGIVVFEDAEENAAELLINQAKHPAIVPVNNLYLGDKLVD